MQPLSPSSSSHISTSKFSSTPQPLLTTSTKPRQKNDTTVRIEILFPHTQQPVEVKEVIKRQAEEELETTTLKRVRPADFNVPTLVLGIDPGVTNLGWAILDCNTKKKVDGGTFELAKLAQVKGNDSKLANLIARFWDQFAFMDYVCVEQNTQMRTIETVGAVCLGYWNARGAKVFHANPVTIKAHYSYLGLRQQASRSKEDAMAECRALGYTDFDTNHECDAILLAHFLIVKKISH